MIYIKLRVTACIQECPAEMNSGFHLFQRHCFVSLLSSHLHRQSLLNHPLVCFRSLIYWSLYVELSISCCAANHCHRIHSFRQIKHLSNLLDSARVRTFPMIPLLLLALSADLQLSAHLPDRQFFWEKRLECPVSKQSHFSLSPLCRWLGRSTCAGSPQRSHAGVSPAAPHLLQYICVSTKRCDVPPLNSYEWDEGRLEFMQAQHFQWLLYFLLNSLSGGVVVRLLGLTWSASSHSALYFMFISTSQHQPVNFPGSSRFVHWWAA